MASIMMVPANLFYTHEKFKIFLYHPDLVRSSHPDPVRFKIPDPVGSYCPGTCPGGNSRNSRIPPFEILHEKLQGIELFWITDDG
jgi:hypothetical protein